MTKATSGALLLVLLASGCASLDKLCEPPPTAAEHSGMAGYALQLAHFDAEARSHALEAAQADWQKSNSPHARAKLGLARAQWGYDGFDPEAAVTALRAALDSKAAAGWPESDLAYLRQRIAQLEHQMAEQSAEAALAAENQQLQQALQEAKDKLQAITEIEKTLSEE